MDTGLADKVVLITGASGGLGSQMVRAFAAESARVVIHYCRNRQAAESLARQVGPAESMTVGADLTDERQVERLWAEVQSRFGPVDVVVANAGIWPPEPVPLHRMSAAQWHRTISVDLTAVFFCMREFFRGLERSGGPADAAAVLVGSTAAIFGEAGHADYAAAKGAVVSGLLLSLKNEIVRLAPLGRVNAVCPGWTVTPMTDEFVQQPAVVGRALQTMALHKLGRPGDVASATLFLASSRLAGHITGQVLMVSGGMEGRVLHEQSAPVLGQD